MRLLGRKIEMLQAVGATQTPKAVQQFVFQHESVADHTWKIPNFIRKLAQAKSNNSLGGLESEPFFSSHGYKMKLEINLNEAPRGCAGYMGIYLCLMKSDRDGALPWSFVKRHMFVLVDQQDDLSQRQNIKTTVSPNGEKAFQRPRQRENVGRGPQQFVKHSTLHTRQYIKDHAIFIKIVVDP